jgi:ssDNA-binding Zn-finger/Zn-ribbon topoisomerase 1
MVDATNDTAAIVAGLWENGRDSARHALDHFSERVDGRNKAHHDKWIILSVTHVAECISNMRLLELDSTKFFRGGRIHFPSLSKALKYLSRTEIVAQLRPVETKLFQLLNHLPILRHQYMHQLAPTDPDVSIAAMSLIGILKYVELRTGEKASDIVWQYPPVESDVFGAIRWKRLDEYYEFVELLLKQKYPDRTLDCCPNCGVHAVRFSTCEACFEELESVTCPICDERAYFAVVERRLRTKDVHCPHCGGIHPISN